MTFLFQRVALGAVCTAMHLASTQAFLPSTSLSTSAWKHGSGSPQTVRNGVRGDARSLSTRTAMTLMEGDRNAEHDLFIVGVGYLGKIIGEKWNKQHPEARSYGEARSYTRHSCFMPDGMTFVRRKSRDDNEIRCPNVLFCANPGGNDDYALEVFKAMQDVWDGTGVFVFTSSGSVYEEQKGGVVTEDSPIDPQKADEPLRIAEKVAVRYGGCVVRLAGLYSLDRGPQNVWLEKKHLRDHSLSEINLVSYEDAASAVVAALNAGIAEKKGEEGAPEVAGQVFLAAEDAPIGRQKICEIALSHPFCYTGKMPKFDGDNDDPLVQQTGPRKVYDSSKTRRVLGWAPKYSSMEQLFTESKDKIMAAQELAAQE